MDLSVPVSALNLLERIREVETSHTGLTAYNTIFNHLQKHLNKPITEMTLLEVQQGQIQQWANHNNGKKLTRSSATGAYQFMYKTLGELIEQHDLNIHMKFTPALQDWLGYQLLIKRNYFDWISGRIGRTAFGNQLAREWASFPVLSNINGKKRGQSYYQGDGLNSSLTTAKAIEDLLDMAIRSPHEPADKVEEPEPEPPIEEGEDTDPIIMIPPISIPSKGGMMRNVVIILILASVAVVYLSVPEFQEWAGQLLNYLMEQLNVSVD